MEKKYIKPEEIFINNIKSLVKGLLIDNPNLKNGYYKGGCNNGMSGDIHEDIKRFGNEIINAIEDTKHLIIESNENKLTAIEKSKACLDAGHDHCNLYHCCAGCPFV